jgi:hypothetical protein
MIALAVVAVAAGAFGLASLQPVSAQPGGPSVCLSLPPGEHTFTAPSQDREGEVSFTVTVGEGGVVTGFTEPGGQSIPPAAMIEIFTGEDSYPLPEGVSFVECEASDDSMMEQGGASELCLNLDPGTYEETVSASGQTYNITINVGEGSRLTSVEVLGTSYAPADALALLAQFGAAIPPHIQILPCEGPIPTLYANTGTGGLADTSNSSGLWSAVATLGVLLAVASTIVVRRRRAEIRSRD